jgi:ribosome-binding protein aMBF1 (putative translation factor)
MPELSLPPRVVDGDFGGWLQDAMKTRGISQRVLAMRSGIDHSTISRIAKGRTPSSPTAVALLSVLLPPALCARHGAADGRARGAA